jgi:hypothetical protein
METPPLEASIDIAAMSHVEYDDLCGRSIHLVDYAVIAHADTIESLGAFEFLYSVWERLFR